MGEDAQSAIPEGQDFAPKPDAAKTLEEAVKEKRLPNFTIGTDGIMRPNYKFTDPDPGIRMPSKGIDKIDPGFIMKRPDPKSGIIRIPNSEPPMPKPPKSQEITQQPKANFPKNP